MRICFSLHHHYNRSAGAPGAVIELARALREIGHDVTTVGFDDLPRILPARVRSLFYPFWLAGFLLRVDRRFDVVDASTGDAWMYGVLRKVRSALKRKASPLLVTHSHGLEHVMHDVLMRNVREGRERVRRRYHLYHGGYRLWEVGRSLRTADLCLFLNREDRQYAIERLGVDAHRCHVVPNGCDDALLDQVLQLPKAAGGFNVVQLGSYIPRKGIATTADAMGRMMQMHADARMWFLGTACSAERVLADYPPALHERIRVIERYDRGDLMKMVADKHVLLFPSLFEGAPLALLEGMACGLVPVASDIPGVREVVTNGVDALTFPAHDADACAAQLRRLAEDRPLLDRMARAARKRAEDFRWSDIARRRVELYRGFLMHEDPRAS